MNSKSITFLGTILGLLFAVNAHAQCDESTLNLEEAKQELIEIFSNNIGQKTMGFQARFSIQFEDCKATVTKNSDSENKQGTPLVYSFNLQDVKGKMVKYYATKKNTQLTIKIDKQINDTKKVQYITFEGVKDDELADNLPKLISQAQCLCANSIK